LTKPKVLIIDDDQNGAETIQKHLKEIGCTCMTAGSVPEGILLIGRSHFDLITTCVLLPGVDGFELMRRMKAVEKEMLCPLPVVVISARSQQKYKDEARALGAADYILKPYRPEDLKVRIRRVLEKQGYKFAQ